MGCGEFLCLEAAILFCDFKEMGSPKTTLEISAFFLKEQGAYKIHLAMAPIVVRVETGVLWVSWILL